MLLYTLNWSKEKIINKFKDINRITVNIKGITSEGETVVLQKKYDEWIGICTKDIKKTLKIIRFYFPDINLKFIKLNNNQYKKILPNFKERLFKKKKLIYTPKNFYKVYSNNAYINDVGILMDKYKISYYTPDDWLTRLYIDLCTTNNSNNFYYQWYNVLKSEMLLDSMKLNVDYNENPGIKIASFDLETIPVDGENRVPTGHDENDKIVMISVIKWNYKDDGNIKKILLYLNPIRTKLSDTNKSSELNNLCLNLNISSSELSDTCIELSDSCIKLNNIPDSIEFSDEREMLKTFHALVQDCHILTGYNINNFDFPCLLARLLLLNMKRELNMYSSKKIGIYIVPTFQDKIVIDMYHFIKIFSNYNLPSLKLDAVAKCKLNKSKFPIKATTIHHYYLHPMDQETLLCKDKIFLYDLIKPKNIELSEFGTFLDCLEYCMEDSVLVYELFKKELALTFLIERANVTSIDMEQALHLGNTKYILEVFKTYGTCMGFFLNVEFFKNNVEKDLEKYKEFLVFKQNKYTYQGALNFGMLKFYQNVTSLDFLSMYPSITVNHNLSYETSGLLFLDEYLTLPEDVRNQCDCIPYRKHSEDDILIDDKFDHDVYTHPKIDLSHDKLIMVAYKGYMGFLPSIMNIFLEKRKEIQRQYKQTKESALYTRQLNIKLFLNSMYGCMGSTDSPLAYLDIAMMITCFARMYILAVCEYAKQVLHCPIAYCDTDGIVVQRYPLKGCDLINRYLNQKFMILQFEKAMSSLLVLSKKKYVYEENDEIKMTGFEKKANALTKWMTETIVTEVIQALKNNERKDIGKGWLIWVNTLIRAFVMCKNPKTYCITRKAKQLHEYKSTTCPQLKIIKKNPSRAGEFIEYTYGQTDIAYSESSNWIMEVDECEEVNFEKLFISQKKIFLNLLNFAFFGMQDPSKACNKVLNTMRWKSFVNAELLSKWKYNKPIMILVLKSLKYTFELNEC